MVAEIYYTADMVRAFPPDGKRYESVDAQRRTSEPRAPSSISSGRSDRNFRLTTAALLLWLGACGPGGQNGPAARSGPEQEPAEPAFIVGTITDLDPGEVRIEEVPADSFGSAKLVARLTSATLVARAGARVDA